MNNFYYTSKCNLIKTLLTYCFVYICSVGYCQNNTSPFVIKGEVAAPIFISSFSMLGGAYELSRKHTIPSEASILSMNRNSINSFDRSATYQNSKWAKIASDGTMYFSAALPLIHLASPTSRKDFGKIALMDVEVFLLNTSVTNLIKEAAHRPRPLVFNPNVPMNEKRQKESFLSFFSGHTSTVASQSFFFAYTYQLYHPKSKWTPLVWSLSAALPMATACFRWKAGKHYWTDVLTGYAVGAIIGVGVPWLHSTKLWNKTK